MTTKTDHLSLRTRLLAHRYVPWLGLILLYFLPPTLLWLGIIPYAYRFVVLFAATIAMVIFAIVMKYSWHELGFRRDTLRSSLIWNGVVTLILGTGLLIAYFAGLIRQPTVPGTNSTEQTLFFLFYTILSGPWQEFLFRSLIFAILARMSVTNGYFLVLFTAFAFSYTHIFYNDVPTLIVTFLMGLIWGTIYFKYPNFWGVALSHSILGSIAIAVGLV